MIETKFFVNQIITKFQTKTWSRYKSSFTLPFETFHNRSKIIFPLLQNFKSKRKSSRYKSLFSFYTFNSNQFQRNSPFYNNFRFIHRNFRFSQAYINLNFLLTHIRTTIKSILAQAKILPLPSNSPRIKLKLKSHRENIIWYSITTFQRVIRRIFLFWGRKYNRYITYPTASL